GAVAVARFAARAPQFVHAALPRGLAAAQDELVGVARLGRRRWHDRRLGVFTLVLLRIATVVAPVLLRIALVITLVIARVAAVVAFVVSACRRGSGGRGFRLLRGGRRGRFRLRLLRGGGRHRRLGLRGLLLRGGGRGRRLRLRRCHGGLRRRGLRL